MMAEQFWRERRVLVTGHTGFKGGWLSVWLWDLGALVTGYALEPESPDGIFSRCKLDRAIDSRIGDIRDLNHLERVFDEVQPEIVFHLAAQALVRRAYYEPLVTLETNVVGTANVLEAVRRTRSVEAVVVVTSDKCYENAESARGYRENDPLGGHDPYSASKACTEIVCAAYRRSFFENKKGGVCLATVRAGNVIGGGDWSDDRIMPDAIKAFARGVPLLVRNPSSVRPWQHVLDPLSGYMSLAKLLYKKRVGYAGSWNFGPRAEDAVTVSKLVDTIARYWGCTAKWRNEQSESSFYESGYLRLDCGKARKHLGWYPSLRLDEAVELAVHWYREAVTGEDTNMNEISLQQIHNYEQRLRDKANETPEVQ